MTDNNKWEQKLIEKVMLSSFKEKSSTRWWNVFFRFITIIIIFIILWQVFFSEITSKFLGFNPKNFSHTAVINISGVIASNEEANALNIMNSLDRAFCNPEAKGVILRINSPGGTPVQASMIYNHMKKLQIVNPDVKVYAVIEDVGASGAYLIACSANNIYCNPSSIVGSIGVLLNSFGFVDIMDKIGIERRVYTSGIHKNMLDQFSPRNLEEDRFIENSLNVVHQEFIQCVKYGRGDRLILNDDIFSGRFWTGREALSLGLVDGFYDVKSIANEFIKAPAIFDYSNNLDFWSKFNKNVDKYVKNIFLVFFSLMFNNKII